MTVNDDENGRRSSEDELDALIADLLEEIEAAPVPERLRELARRLQAALAERAREPDRG